MKKKDTNKEAKNIKLLEARRQLFHAIVGILIVAFFYYDILPLWLFFIIAVTALVIYMAWEEGYQPVLDWFIRNFERDKAEKGIGALWYVLGCFFTLLLFPKHIALAALMILALGDSVSHFFGQFFGKIPHPFNKKKNVEGTLLGILAGFAGSVIFVDALPAFVAAFVAMNAEVIEWKIGRWKLNDNFYIPIFAGIVLFLLTL